MIDPHEPRDGDFVAYLERLQRESAERLLRPSTPTMVEPSSTARPSPAPARNATLPPVAHPSTDSLEARAAPHLNKAEVEQLMARLAQSRSASRAVGAVIALTVAAFLFLLWLVTDRSGFLLIAAIALAAWGGSRLRAALQDFSSRDRQLGRELVARWFGPRRSR